MRLLVTGASGFIGRNMLLALPTAWQIIALHRPSNEDFLRFIEQHRLMHVQAVPCDLTDEMQVKQVFGRCGTQFDSCLALASNTSIPGSIADPTQDLRINAMGLLHILRSGSFDHLVYFSSGAVYIGLEGLVHPGVALRPTLPYAISKLAAENYIHAFTLHHAMPRAATILRFFGAYGPYEPARKLYTKLVRRFAFERDPHFTITGDGENYIDAMNIEDAVKATMAVLSQPAPDGVRRFDLGVGSRESVNQVVKRAAHTFGIEPDLQYEGQSPEYIQFYIDPGTFAAAFQFAPSISLETGLQRLAEHLSQEQH